jgi:hypothetical protein
MRHGFAAVTTITDNACVTFARPAVSSWQEVP